MTLLLLQLLWQHYRYYARIQNYGNVVVKIKVRSPDKFHWSTNLGTRKRFMIMRSYYNEVFNFSFTKYRSLSNQIIIKYKISLIIKLLYIQADAN